MATQNNEWYRTCSRCKREFHAISVRRCKHPAVNRVFGEYICYYCCKQCQHHTREKHCGAIGCDYKP